MTAPLPPADLASRTPEIVTVPAKQDLHRFFTAAHEPIHYDDSDAGRLNAPDASYGVLYTAREIDGAFAETFLRTPGLTLIDPDLLARKAYVRLVASRALRLTKLAGPGLAILGATAEVTHGGLPYTAPQAWSKALRAHPQHADGIAYYARHDDEALCYALFDSTRNVVTEIGREMDLDQDWFWTVALRYSVGFTL